VISTDFYPSILEIAGLAGQMPERVRQLRDRLHAWYGEVDAKFLRPKPGGPEPWSP
jgi:hypothetical protein